MFADYLDGFIDGLDNITTYKWFFNGPSTACSRYVTAVSSVAAILPMVARFSNSTYTLDFNGPSVKCRPANPTEIKAINKTWEDTSLAQTGYYYYFLAIVFDGSINGTDVVVDLSRDYAATKEAIKSKILYSTIVIDTGPTGGEEVSYTSSSCQLYNASYRVQFDYSEGQQRIQIKNVSYNDPIPALAITYQDPFRSPQESFTYQAIAIALYQQIVGYIYFSGTTTRYQQTLLAAANDVKRYSDLDLDPGLRSLYVRNLTMGQLIEELSQNITLSLFSVPEFL